jgi:hypothetical protein
MTNSYKKSTFVTDVDFDFVANAKKIHIDFYVKQNFEILLDRLVLITGNFNRLDTLDD